MKDVFRNPDYLKTQQYANADKLVARMRLHTQYSTTNVDLHDWLFDHLLSRIPQSATGRVSVLECGAGRADVWAKNMTRIPANWTITLTDLSIGMLNDGKALLGANAARFTFQEADVQALPFADASFDVVMANYMLYHVPDVFKAIAELRRVLRPDGILFAMTNGDNHMRELNAMIGTFEMGDAHKFGLMNVRGVFTLQNGADKLRASFAEVERIDFKSDLRVTAIQPIVDYVASALDDPDGAFAGKQGQEFIAVLQSELDANGAIHITKETGLFIARGTKT